MRIPLFAPAFTTADSQRTTLRWSEYCKKLAAENQDSKALLVPWGLPKSATNSSSELTDTTEETGPF